MEQQHLQLKRARSSQSSEPCVSVSETSYSLTVLKVTFHDTCRWLPTDSSLSSADSAGVFLSTGFDVGDGEGDGGDVDGVGGVGGGMCISSLLNVRLFERCCLLANGDSGRGSLCSCTPRRPMVLVPSSATIGMSLPIEKMMRAIGNERWFFADGLMFNCAPCAARQNSR